MTLSMLAVGDVAALLLRADGLDEARRVLTGSTWGHLWLARTSRSHNRSMTRSDAVGGSAWTPAIRYLRACVIRR